jgi:hypothetical protein
MLKSLKRSWRELKEASPGERFQRHYERRQSDPLATARGARAVAHERAPGGEGRRGPRLGGLGRAGAEWGRDVGDPHLFRRGLHGRVIPPRVDEPYGERAQEGDSQENVPPEPLSPKNRPAQHDLLPRGHVGTAIPPDHGARFGAPRMRWKTAPRVRRGVCRPVTPA